MKKRVIVPLVLSALTAQNVLALTIQEVLEQRRAEAERASVQTSQQKVVAPKEQQAKETAKQETKKVTEIGNADVFVAEHGMPPLDNNTPFDKVVEAESKADKVKTIIVTHDGLPTPIELTIGEFEFLEAKKEKISQYLYENYELEEVRNLLREYHRNQEFEKYMDKSIPLTAEEIFKYRQAKQQEQIALNTRITPIKHHIRTMDVNIEGSQPITVFVSKGLASSIVFFDSTGAPWPVEGEVIGDSSSYASNIITDNKNVVTFTILKEFVETNALITLKGISTPIVLKLVSNGVDNDDRLSARIPKLGPSAEVSYFVNEEFENQDQQMIDVLNTNQMENGKEYVLSGVQGKIFVKDGVMYVKSFHQLVSPSWKRQITSTTGYTIYEVKPTTKLLFNVDGSLVQAEVKDLDLFNIKFKQVPFK